MDIINLTYTQGIPGVMDFHKDSFNNILLRHMKFRGRQPDPRMIHKTAEFLADWALGAFAGYGTRAPRGCAALLEGPPYLLAALEYSLMARGIEPVYARNYKGHKAKVVKGTIELIRPRKP